jgi:transcriptional regulator with XRE-family HTH domain
MTERDTAASLLRELRERQGQTLRSAASDIGVAASQLSRMERGERAIGEATAQRLSNYYDVPAEVISLAQGDVPLDIVAILRRHPEELIRLREKYSE